MQPRTFELADIFYKIKKMKILLYLYNNTLLKNIHMNSEYLNDNTEKKSHSLNFSCKLFYQILQCFIELS